MATTEGLTSATTSAMLGSCLVVWLAVGGGVHSGLIAVGTGVGVLVAAGGTGVFGVVMVMQPDTGITASDRTITKTMNRVFKLSLFIFIYIIA
jgi:hypothetical protein